MSKVKNDTSALEQKLADIDFYNEFADKEKMFGKFIKSLNGMEYHSTPVMRRRILHSALAAAFITLFFTATGVTAFAGGLDGLLRQLGFAGGNANQIEQISGDYANHVVAVPTVYNSDITYDNEIEWQRHTFSSFEETQAAMCFTLAEPVGLPYSWELKSIKGVSDGENINPNWVELIYNNISAVKDSSIEAYNISKDSSLEFYITSSNEELPLNTAFWVYQQYIGEGASLNIDTTNDIQTVAINGIEAVLIGAQPYDWRSGYSLIWVQNGVRIDICPMNCTYDELISFAEAFAVPVKEQ